MGGGIQVRKSRFSDEQLKQLMQKVVELVLDMDILKEATKGRPFVPRTSDE